MPGILAVSVMMLLIHWLGPSSVEAVSSMQNIHSRNIGRKASRNMSPVDTPEATRSVAGNFTPRKSTPYRSVAIRMGTILIFQPNAVIAAVTVERSSPSILVSAKAASPPITMPPGNHAWSTLSLCVLSSG